jgi:hypothetical protein
LSVDVPWECSVRKLMAADGFRDQVYVHTDVKYLDQDILVHARTGTQESPGTAHDEPPTSHWEVNIK